MSVAMMSSQYQMLLFIVTVLILSVYVLVVIKHKVALDKLFKSTNKVVSVAAKKIDFEFARKHNQRLKQRRKNESGLIKISNQFINVAPTLQQSIKNSQPNNDLHEDSKVKKKMVKSESYTVKDYFEGMKQYDRIRSLLASK